MSGVEVNNLGPKLGMLSSPKREGWITFDFFLDREGNGGMVREVAFVDLGVDVPAHVSEFIKRGVKSV